MTKAAERHPIYDFLERYMHAPSLFVKEVLGITPDKWQEEFLAAIARGDRRISVRSAHGVGKSSAASWAILWHIVCRFPQKTVITAPTSSQLFDALFAELKATIQKMPPVLQGLLVVTSDRISLKAAPDESFISARTARAETPEALQGVHSQFVMLVADEASGVPEPVFEAAVGSMSGHNAVTLLLGNPTRTSGFFYRTHNSDRAQWTTFHVSAFDSKLVSKDFIEQVKQSYGEESNAYRVRVLGEFPRADDDTLIPLELVEDAIHRDVLGSPTASIVWGLDVARFGDDSSALCKRKNNIVTEPIRRWKKLDLMQLTGAVKAEYDAAGNARPEEILVDSIGLGAGVVDRLRELNLPARGINVSESPALGQTYANLRSELWHKAKQWLSQRDCKLPKDETLIAELVSPRYFFRSSGKVAIESKDDMKRRGLPSPDGADAFILTFASDAGTALYGSKEARNWRKPLKRGIRGIV